MKIFDHLVEWDQLDVRIRGRKVQQIIEELLLQQDLPVSDLRLEFLEGKILVTASIQKVFTIPIRFTVSTIAVAGKTVEVALQNVATFGIIPIPKLLFRFIRALGLPDGITFNRESLTVTVLLERFIPDFIDLRFESIRMIPDGLAVHLGSGGADLAVRRL